MAQTGDQRRQRARERLTQARQTASQLGMTLLEHQATEWERRLA
jgi:hypothetical protein